MEYKFPAELEAYTRTSGTFSELLKIKGSSKKRKAAKKAFLDHETYVPDYDYPKLDNLHDRDDKGKFLRDTKSRLYEAILELEANKESGFYSPEEFEMYAEYFELRLKRIMLTEAAQRMRYANSSSAQLTARTEFMTFNRELFGDIDDDRFSSMMATEQQRINDFLPVTGQAMSIKKFLVDYFEDKSFDGEEQLPTSEETLHKLHDVIMKRYEKVLAVVPDTDDDTVYDVSQCVDIFNDALEASGLKEKGWKAKEDSSVSNPTTSVEKSLIKLPSDTARTADELRRLIVHELEDHARRGQVGKDSKNPLLENGTADYAAVEEGLGVLFECAIAGSFDNDSYNRVRDRYITAGLALGSDGIPKDAASSFEVLWRLLAVRNSRNGIISDKEIDDAKSDAFEHIVNAFRMTNFAMPGVIYMRLKMYHDGVMENGQYYEDHKDNIDGALDQAMLGKTNHTNQQEIDTVYKMLVRSTSSSKT